MIFYLCHRRKILYSLLQFDFNMVVVIFGEHSVVKSKLPSTRKTRIKILHKTTWICLKVFGNCFEGQKCQEDPKSKQLKQLISGKGESFWKVGKTNVNHYCLFLASAAREAATSSKRPCSLHHQFLPNLKWHPGNLLCPFLLTKSLIK